MADDKDANAFMLLYYLTAKQHKKRTIWVRRWLLDRLAICWSHISLADCLWKLNHALEVGRLYRSSDACFTAPHSVAEPQNSHVSAGKNWSDSAAEKPKYIDRCFVISTIKNTENNNNSN